MFQMSARILVVSALVACQSPAEPVVVDTSGDVEFVESPDDTTPEDPWWWPEPIHGVPMGTIRYLGLGDAATCPGAIDGTVYSASQLELLAIDIDTASVRWTADIYSDYEFFPGLGRRPEKQGETIYYAYGNAMSTVYALDEESGDLLWSNDGFSNGKGTDAQHVYGLEDGGVAALDRLTGDRVWFLPDGGQFATTGHHLLAQGGGEIRRLDEASGGTIWSVPASVWDTVGDADRLFTQSGDDIFALNPATGSEFWSRPSSGDRGSYAGVDGTTIFVERQPVDPQDGGDQILVAIDSVSGEELWTTVLPRRYAPFSTAPAPIVGEHAVYSAAVGVFAYDKQTGEPIWQMPEFYAGCYSVYDGKIYGVDGRNWDGGVYEIGLM